MRHSRSYRVISEFHFCIFVVSLFHVSFPGKTEKSAKPITSRLCGYKKDHAIDCLNKQFTLRGVFHNGGSWWIRTTEALSSRFTVCPHWPLGKAPIFGFVSAVSPGDVCYYSKADSKLQALFKIFLRFFQKSLFPSQQRVKTFLDIRFGLAYIYNII